MKLKITILTTAFAGIICLATWRVSANPEASNDLGQLNTPGNHDPASVEEADPAKIETRIKEQEGEVRDRLELPALIVDRGDRGEEAEILELYRSGWIINATVDEVDAALKAAEKTPELEDDVAARVLAHRASCRYFFSE